MANLETLQTRLAQAEDAHHKLMTGSLEERVDTGAGYAVAYTRTDEMKLLNYINSLKTQIAAAGGTTDGLRRKGLVVDL